MLVNQYKNGTLRKRDTKRLVQNMLRTLRLGNLGFMVDYP